MGIREDMETDLSETLEASDDFGMSIVFTGPDGAQQTVYGRVTYDTIVQDENGNAIVDDMPCVTIRRSSMDPLPANGQKWSVAIPSSPRSDATTEIYMMDRASEHGRSIGVMQIYLRKAEAA